LGEISNYLSHTYIQVYIPLILLWDSSVIIVEAVRRSKAERLERSSFSSLACPSWLYSSIALVLLIYNILVPLIIFTATDTKPENT